MKASELMIGDWVNIYVFPNENPQIEDLFPARISTIMTPLPSENSGEHIECVFKVKDGGIGRAARPVETCLPIPLTAEILEKNGFRKYPLMGEQRHFIYTYGKVSLLAIYDADFSCHLCSEAWKVKYVHELQQILRVCKENKKADNFKV